ncbi:glutathione synthetase-like isoform X2 [Oculina patagonica]
MSTSHVSGHYGNNLSADDVNFLACEGRDYFLANGMIYKSQNGNLQHRPFTLLPTPFPKKLFTAAREVQTDFNLLVHKASQDFEFIKEALLSTVAADSFTAKLFVIYEKAWKRGTAQPISLGIFRSDYLIDTTGASHNHVEEEDADLCIKQVELNTISISAITSSSRTTNLHRHLLSLIGQESKSPPPNPALDEVADGLIRAWELYGSESAVIMFIVRPDEVNVYVQRVLEYHIKYKNSAVKVIRRSLTDIFNNSEMGDEKSLFVNGLEVAVAYFRAGYTPTDYPTENEWTARFTIELSRCIKCPTVAHQLMGTKKMQQVFAEPRVLERFIPNKESVDRVRRTFTGLYSLDPGPVGDRNVTLCLKKVEKFVLKPQREGGGNLIYGEDIRRTLLSNPENRAQYILMDRIQPASINKNIIVRQESMRPVESISELGVFGIFISRGDEILVNKEGGYLVRSRPWNMLEVISLHGEGAYGSPYLDCLFKKMHDNTALRVFFSGALHILGCSRCCKRWFFTFNGAECSGPMPIDGIFYMQVSDDQPLRVRHIEGYCENIYKGECVLGSTWGTAQVTAMQMRIQAGTQCPGLWLKRYPLRSSK